MYPICRKYKADEKRQSKKWRLSAEIQTWQKKRERIAQIGRIINKEAFG